MANSAHKPTAETRAQVETYSGVGVPHDQIAILIGIAPKTLRKHYRESLDIGEAKATSNVAKTLYKQATSGNTAALIFWMKARAGWREKVDVTTDGKAFPAFVVRVERE